MPVGPGDEGADCPQCGSVLPPSTRFCGACGHTLPLRTRQSYSFSASPTVGAAPAASPQDGATTVEPATAVKPASSGVRCASFLLDLAAMVSPALPLSLAGAVLGVAQVVYIVVPVAFVAVWLWMQVLQGLTGVTFGKAMLGLRLVNGRDDGPPGLPATILRSAVFTGSLGLAGIPVVLAAGPTDGLHDRLSGLRVIDVALGANPLGPRQQTTLRISANHAVTLVHSPIPVSASRRG